VRLRIVEEGRWTILSTADDTGAAEITAELASLARRADAAGLVAILEQCAASGPFDFPDVISHDVGDGVREFVKGRHRLLYFVPKEGAIVVCSHVLLKQSQKTPKRDRDRASRLRAGYDTASAAGRVEIIRDTTDE